MICVCGHRKSSHIGKDIKGLCFSDAAILRKYGGWCEVCLGNQNNGWHDFKLDNLRYLEELSK